jgi:hypothetical protein
MRTTPFFLVFLLACGKGAAEKSGGSVSATPSASVSASVPAASASAKAEPKPSIKPEEVLAALNPDGNPTYSGPVGAVEGTIFVTGRPAPDTDLSLEKCPQVAGMYGKLFREKSLPGVKDRRALGDAIVGITGYDGIYVAPKETSKTLEVRDCAFNTRTVVLTFGERLDVFNRDAAGTKTFYALSLAKAGTTALRVAAPSTDPLHFYPREAGRDRLLDNLDRPFLYVDVFTVRFPLHDVSNADGHFRIEGIPVGKRKLNVTHPAFDSNTTIDVDVPADGTVTKDVVVNFRGAPTEGAAKPDAGH